MAFNFMKTKKEHNLMRIEKLRSFLWADNILRFFFFFFGHEQNLWFCGAQKSFGFLLQPALSFSFLKKKKGRGQTSIEFLLVILIILIYLQATIQPAVTNTSYAIEDTKRVGLLKIAGEKLANSINEIAVLSGEGKKTIELILPPKSTINVNNPQNYINGVVILKSQFAEGETLPTGCAIFTPDIGCGFNLPLITTNIQGTKVYNNDSEKNVKQTVVIEKKLNGAIDVS